MRHAPARVRLAVVVVTLGLAACDGDPCGGARLGCILLEVAAGDAEHRDFMQLHLDSRRLGLMQVAVVPEPLGPPRPLPALVPIFIASEVDAYRMRVIAAHGDGLKSMGCAVADGPERSGRAEERITLGSGCDPLYDVVQSDVTTNIQDVWACGAVAVAVGDGSPSVLRSEDGGRSWVGIDAPGLLRAIWGASCDNLFAVGVEGRVLVSDNGGITWTKHDSGTPETLYAVWGRDPGDLFAAGKGSQVRHSTDGGLSWTPTVLAADGEPTFALRAGWANPAESSGAVVVGEGGRVFRSTDGIAWIQRPTGTAHDLLALANSESSTLIAAGRAGTVLISRDGGQRWSEAVTGALEDLYGVWGAAGGELLAVGDGGLVLRTLDEGASWSAVRGVAGNLTSIAGERPDDLYIGTSFGRLVRRTDW